MVDNDGVGDDDDDDHHHGHGDDEGLGLFFSLRFYSPPSSLSLAPWRFMKVLLIVGDY